MPNWCSNRLEVGGSKKDIQALLKFIKGKDTNGEPLVFDFEKVLPTPKELLEVSSPNRDNASASQLTKLFGFPDWYGWRNHNWSTKWNLSYDSTELTVDDDGKSASFSFDTAWCPPYGIINALGLKFPKIYFELTYCEPGECFAGVYKVKGEKISDESAARASHAYEEIAEQFGYNQEQFEEDA